MTNDYDAEFEQHNIAAGSGGLRWMSMLVMILVVFGFFSLVWYAYNTSMDEQQDDTVAVIAAENPTYKTKPDDVGGLDVADKDIEAYQLMRREPDVAQEVAQVERLMPSADKPIIIETVPKERVMQKVTENVPELKDIENAEATMSAVAPTKESTKQDQAKLEVLIKEAAQAPAPQPQKQAPTAIISKPDIVEVVKQPAPVAAPKPAPKPVVAPKPAPKKAVSASGAYIQLAALRSVTEAERLWKKLRAKHNDVLGGLAYYTQSVNVAGTGTLYRLRAKGMSSHAKAKSICSTLAARGQSCIASK